ATDRLGELGGPDNLPPDPHPAPDLTDGSTLACCGQPQPVDPADIHRLGAGAQNALVDRATDGSTDGPTDDGPRQAKNRAAKARANGCAGGRKKQCSHSVGSFR